MAFVHAKNARIYIDGFDVSHYFNEATMQGKVDTAETTTFAATPGVSVAKTVIPGVKDGTITLKGLWDGTIENLVSGTTGPDNYFYTLLSEETGVGAVLTPSNVEACLSVAPTGSWAPGARVWAAASVLSQYSLAAPVKNAVTITGDIQCDGGVDTGVSLHDPTTSDTMVTPVTITAGQTLPATTLTAGSSTASYPSSGTLLVTTSAGSQFVSYTGLSGDTFTGCTGGTGTTTASAALPVNFGTGVNDAQLPETMTTTVTVASGQVLTVAAFTLTVTGNPTTAGFPNAGALLVPTSGGAVTVYYTGITTTSFTGCTAAAAGTTSAGSITLAPVSSIAGAYGFLHVGAIGGVSGGLTLAKLQHSDDNSTWTDVPNGAWTINNTGLNWNGNQFGSGQYSGGTNGSGSGAATTGGYILFIPPGTPIQRYVRTALVYASPTTSAKVLVTFVRL